MKTLIIYCSMLLVNRDLLFKLSYKLFFGKKDRIFTYIINIKLDKIQVRNYTSFNILVLKNARFSTIEKLQ